MFTLQTKQVKDFYYYYILNELHNVKAQIALLESKYKMNFIEFEKHVKSMKNENYELWDDYIKWKAYDKSLDDIILNKKDLEDGNYRIS